MNAPYLFPILLCRPTFSTLSARFRSILLRSPMLPTGYTHAPWPQAMSRGPWATGHVPCPMGHTPLPVQNQPKRIACSESAEAHSSHSIYIQSSPTYVAHSLLLITYHRLLAQPAWLIANDPSPRARGNLSGAFSYWFRQ